MNDDLSYFLGVLEKVHPNPYYRVPRATVIRDVEELRSKLKQPMTIGDFERELSAFVRSFGDGHTAIWGPQPPPTADHSTVAQSALTWKFEMRADGIAYLDFFGMDHGVRPQWQVFLNRTFQEIAARRPRGLIVDIRKNGGGDSELGDDLLQYLTDKPYRQASRKEWRFSTRVLEAPTASIFFTSLWAAPKERAIFSLPGPKQATLKKQNPSPQFKRKLLAGAPEWMREYLRENAPQWLDLQSHAATDETLTWDLSDLIRPNPNFVLRYGGPICFLIGQGTFSSGLMLANTVQDFHLATLIGQETQPCNEFGEAFFFMLPNSGIDAMAPSATFIRANGDASDMHGVLPDVPVVEEAGKDVGLQTAITWVNGQVGKVR